MPGFGRFLAFDVLASRPRHDTDDRREGHPSGVRAWRRAARMIRLKWRRRSSGRAADLVR